MDKEHEVSENEDAPEKVESQDFDDSEKTNITVIDSTQEVRDVNTCDPTLTEDEDLPEDEEECEEMEEVNWEVPSLMADLNVMHEEMKSRILKEMREVKGKTDTSSARLVKQERRAAEQREESLKVELDKLREEISDQNKALQHKDEVIKKLVAQIRQQKERVKLAQVFANWRSHEELRKRQAFCSKMASRHSDMQHQKRALFAWRSVLETSWKERVQRTCRVKAEEVCIRLATEYEEKTRQLTVEVERLSRELQRREERQQQEKDELRAAVMRGVCALNLETMGIMQDDPRDAGRVATPDSPEVDEAAAVVADPPEKSLVGTVARQRVTTGAVLRKSASGGSGDSGLPPRFNARHRPIAGQDEAAARRSNPSSATSILVERHHPVNKRTAASVLASHERSVRAVSHPPL